MLINVKLNLWLNSIFLKRLMFDVYEIKTCLERLMFDVNIVFNFKIVKSNNFFVDWYWLKFNVDVYREINVLLVIHQILR